MEESWVSRWNDRFSRSEYVYGKEPNDFLKEQLLKLTPGTILFPAEGEGRNAVFAARNGWSVSAFDISEAGRKKALLLADENKVAIDYSVASIDELHYRKGEFDAIALIYAHFPAEVKSDYHKHLRRYLKKGGMLIFEAFSKNHIAYNSKNPSVGGPSDVAMLFSVEEIAADFVGFDVITLREEVVYLNEGPFHSGTGSVIRFIGRKTED